MLFNSFSFLVFFPVVTLFYFAVPRRARGAWLLAASYFFYMSWNWRYGFLLLFCTAVSFAGAIAVERRRKKSILAATLAVLFAALFFYKYAGFTLRLIGQALALARVPFPAARFDVVLPVGISFFTFQAVGYVADVWRGETRAERNFFRYALFVSFFPQLVAGPIERSGNLLGQLESPRPFDFGRARTGLFLILWGVFLKLVIADRAALFVDGVYASWRQANGIVLALATVLFAFQIYCDFYGYSIIAKGTARILGIELMDNFNAPYLAVSLQEFWRRWHISLSTWLRDYLYIPLGGSRRSPLRRRLNIMLVMLASGVWHGAGLNFVAWGAFHGALQICEQACASVLALVPKSVRWLGTFFWTCAAWVFFRAESVGAALRIFKRVAVAVVRRDICSGEELFSFTLGEQDARLLGAALVILLVADFLKRKGVSVPELVARRNPALQMAAVALSVMLISVYGIWGSDYNAASFIYFQF